MKPMLCSVLRARRSLRTTGEAPHCSDGGIRHSTRLSPVALQGVGTAKVSQVQRDSRSCVGWRLGARPVPQARIWLCWLPAHRAAWLLLLRGTLGTSPSQGPENRPRAREAPGAGRQGLPKLSGKVHLQLPPRRATRYHRNSWWPCARLAATCSSCSSLMRSSSSSRFSPVSADRPMAFPPRRACSVGRLARA